MNSPITSNRFCIEELVFQDVKDALHVDIQQGLFKNPRSLPPKYFYDDQGSKLFDAICKTHDYYPTLTEAALLEKHAEQIIQQVNPTTIIELGAGTSIKSEILLSEISEHMQTNGLYYISIDVCKEVLIETAQRLLGKYSSLSIKSIVGEYAPAIQAISNCSNPALYLFIGSSIGNFTQQDAIELLTSVTDKMNAEDYFLIGMDRIKDKSTLERAYDDSDGITARFNLNVLNVLNNHLGSNFDISNFFHKAVYNEIDSQIEMYLISNCEQEIHFPTLNKTMRLLKDEKILTEISRKYSKQSIQYLLDKSGLQQVMHFEPENEYFSLVLAKKAVS